MHPTNWTSSQWIHAISSTPCHGALTSVPLSAHRSIEWECTASQIETPTSYPLLNNSSVHLTTKSEVGRTQTSWSVLRDSVLSSLTHPRGMALPRTACSIAAGMRAEAMAPSETNLLRFSLVLYTNFQLFGDKRKEQSDVYQAIDPPWTKIPGCATEGPDQMPRHGFGTFLATSAVCECGAADQTVDHVVFQCPIHPPPHGLHGLKVLVRKYYHKIE